MSLIHIDHSTLRTGKTCESVMGAKVLTPKLTTSRRQQADSECSNASSNSSEFSDESSQSGNCCICQSCCKPFQTYSELKAYIASEHAQAKKWCSKCRVKATNVRNLKVCTLCGETTSALLDHEAAHYRDKDGVNALFECTKCCRSFFQFNELKRHLKENHSDRRTTPMKSVNCPVCSTKFYSRHQRDQHFIEHFKTTFDTIWETICNMHQNLGEALQSNQCPICGHIMINKRSLKRHVINRHLIHIFKSSEFESAQQPNFQPNCELLPSTIVDILINNSMANYEKDNVLKVFKMGKDDIQDQISLDGTDRKDYDKKTILLVDTDGKNNGHVVGHDADIESLEAKVHKDSQRSRVDSESGTSTSSGFTKSDTCSKQVDLKSYEKTPSSNVKLSNSSSFNSESIDRNISNIAENMTELTKSNTSTATLKHQDITSVRDNSQLSHHSSDTTKSDDDAMDIRCHLISRFMDDKCEWPRCVECEYRFERMFDFEIHLIKKHIPSVFNKQK